MECSCDIDVDVDEYCVLLSTTSPVARKDHYCYECKRLIHTGEKYRNEITVFENKLGVYKTCNDCMSIRDVFFTQFLYGCLTENLHDYIWDCGGDIPESCISKLTIRARARVCEIIEDIWGEEE